MLKDLVSSQKWSELESFLETCLKRARAGDSKVADELLEDSVELPSAYQSMREAILNELEVVMKAENDADPLPVKEGEKIQELTLTPAPDPLVIETVIGPNRRFRRRAEVRNKLEKRDVKTPLNNKANKEEPKKKKKMADESRKKNRGK